MLLGPYDGVSRRAQWLEEKGPEAVKQLVFRNLETLKVKVSLISELKVLLRIERHFLLYSQALQLRLKACIALQQCFRCLHVKMLAVLMTSCK